MSEQVVIDTNLLIYHLDKDSKYYNVSNKIFTNPDFELFITFKNISEFCAVVTKYKIIEEKLLETELDNLLNSFNILLPNERTIDIFTKLFKKYKPEGNRIYDIEIVSIMLSNEIKKIATINKKDFTASNEIDILNIE